MVFKYRADIKSDNTKTVYGIIIAKNYSQACKRLEKYYDNILIRVTLLETIVNKNIIEMEDNEIYDLCKLIDFWKNI